VFHSDLIQIPIVPEKQKKMSVEKVEKWTLQAANEVMRMQ
jgi:hypothetical protein